MDNIDDPFIILRTKFADDLEEILQCPICFEIPNGPVPVCEKGHHYCQTCARKFRFCPTCQGKFRGQRSFLAENLTTKFKEIKSSLLDPNYKFNRRVCRSTQTNTFEVAGKTNLFESYRFPSPFSFQTGKSSNFNFSRVSNSGIKPFIFGKNEANDKESQLNINLTPITTYNFSNLKSTTVTSQIFNNKASLLDKKITKTSTSSDSLLNTKLQTNISSSNPFLVPFNFSTSYCFGNKLNSSAPNGFHSLSQSNNQEHEKNVFSFGSFSSQTPKLNFPNQTVLQNKVESQHLNATNSGSSSQEKITSNVNLNRNPEVPVPGPNTCTNVAGSSFSNMESPTTSTSNMDIVTNATSSVTTASRYKPIRCLIKRADSAASPSSKYTLNLNHAASKAVGNYKKSKDSLTKPEAGFSEDLSKSSLNGDQNLRFIFPLSNGSTSINFNSNANSNFSLNQNSLLSKPVGNVSQNNKPLHNESSAFNSISNAESNSTLNCSNFLSKTADCFTQHNNLQCNKSVSSSTSNSAHGSSLKNSDSSFETKKVFIEPSTSLFKDPGRCKFAMPINSVLNNSTSRNSESVNLTAFNQEIDIDKLPITVRKLCDVKSKTSGFCSSVKFNQLSSPSFNFTQGAQSIVFGGKPSVVEKEKLLRLEQKEKIHKSFKKH